VTRSINTLLHVRSFDWPTLEIGLLTIALILLLERTRVGLLAAVILCFATIERSAGPLPISYPAT
jgi:hypothetical protein